MEQKDLIGLSRSPLVNQLHAIKDSITKSPPKYNMHGLVRQNVLQWLWKNLLHLGNTHYAYQTYQNLELNNGIFKMQEADKEISVALLADWASDTPESHNVADLCGERDYSIHLGDSYYVGNEKEIADNFNSTFGAPWPYGKRGSFALLGNHEMYSSGKTYFTHLLPYMQLYDCGDGAQQQEASFFCLENDYWRVIGLDTGYYSLKGFLGIASNNKLTLHDMQMDWLRNVVQLQKDNRGLIFLSHHQPLSAFEEEYVNPAKQLAGLIGTGRTALWFWGHEHRLAVYGENGFDNGLNVFGRCIGNGGMPVDIDVAPKAESRNLVIYDSRERKRIDGKFPVGYNGYAILKFNGPEVVVEYYDDNDNNPSVERKIMEEKWTVKNGSLLGSVITDFTTGNEKKLTQVQPEVEKAIRKQNV